MKLARGREKAPLDSMTAYFLPFSVYPCHAFYVLIYLLRKIPQRSSQHIGRRGGELRRIVPPILILFSFSLLCSLYDTTTSIEKFSCAHTIEIHQGNL
ncbi:hypothetical protein GGR51DRAFT_358362 [Nemania sp. FL0031]|nr:hypothetical protein GGR51DRAFT_358362 [Nemania sp. FL0031]